MIPFKLQLILILVSFLGIFFIVNMVKKYKIELKYSLLWIFCGLLITVLAIFPSILIFIAKVVGIETPSNALFLFGMLSLFILVFNLTMAASSFTDKIRELTQDLGILKKRIEELENNRKSD
ncbi:DUF2304 domain-containing protein [Gordoniibacillus kamchatkensis]|uniref:DUF2304 domain-containing protein n=1 Tax=Gordoniibacillus kamchatkensis TaxID=1590651 RepID=UPI0009E5C26D|nr:DUF2304 domain-containing protein [Paenibacillus sp. VKM B-2647]